MDRDRVRGRDMVRVRVRVKIRVRVRVRVRCAQVTVAAGAHDLRAARAVILGLGHDRSLVALVERGPAAPRVKLGLERVDGSAALAACEVPG